MDLHSNASSAPDRDAEHRSYNASDPLPGSDAWLAERQKEEQTLNALEAQITELWGNINTATAHFLALLAEFDRREGWAQHGVANCAHWLSWQCGIGAVAAREKVRTARALESLPKIQAAFVEGRLSYSKVRALTRVATAETEEELLHIALNGTAAHVERTVRGFRRVVRYLERGEAEAMHERRYLDCRRDSDGSVKLEARLAPEVGEMLLKALEAAHAELEERGGEAEKAEAAEPAGAADAVSADVSAETSEPLAARPMHSDVSAETSRTQSARWYHLCRAPEDVSAEAPARSVSQRRADALEHILGRFLAGKCSGSAAGAHEVVVHIAHDALCDVPESSGAEFDNGRSVAVETARRLGCDGALDNLVTLCSFHHRKVHEGGFGVRMNEGEIEFLHPDGRVIPPAGKAQEDCFRGNNPAVSEAQRLAAFNAERGLKIDAQTARCRWRGERMDYNIAIDGLCRQAGYT